MIQNFHDYHTITTIAGSQQTLPGGPVASQEVIKELGTNGGGFSTPTPRTRSRTRRRGRIG